MDGFAGAVAGAVIGGGVSAVVAWRVVEATAKANRADMARKVADEAAQRLKVTLRQSAAEFQAVRSNRSFDARWRGRGRAYERILEAQELDGALLDPDVRSVLRSAVAVASHFLGKANSRDQFILAQRSASRHEGADILVRLEEDAWQIQATSSLLGYFDNVRNRIDTSMLRIKIKPDPLVEPDWPDMDTPVAIEKMDT